MTAAISVASKFWGPNSDHIRQTGTLGCVHTEQHVHQHPVNWKINIQISRVNDRPFDHSSNTIRLLMYRALCLIGAAIRTACWPIGKSSAIISESKRSDVLAIGRLSDRESGQAWRSRWSEEFWSGKRLGDRLGQTSLSVFVPQTLII